MLKIPEYFDHVVVYKRRSALDFKDTLVLDFVQKLLFEVSWICSNAFQNTLATEANTMVGAQWLSGRVLDSRPSGCGLQTERLRVRASPASLRCVLEQDTLILAYYYWFNPDPGVASSIPARYHTFVEIDHEIISTVILLPSADLFKKGCCQLQVKVCAQITG